MKLFAKNNSDKSDSTKTFNGVIQQFICIKYICLQENQAFLNFLTRKQYINY